MQETSDIKKGLGWCGSMRREQNSNVYCLRRNKYFSILAFPWAYIMRSDR